MERETITGPSAGKTGLTLREKQSHLALLLANIAWGALAPVSKSILIQGQISPLALSAIRITGAAAVFFLLARILPQSVAPREKIRRGDWLHLLLAATLLISANQGLYIMGVGFTSPIDSAVMCSTTPMITMILAALVLGIPVTRHKFIGVIIGLGGVVLLVNDSNSATIASNPVLGDILCLAAQVCAAVYYVTCIGLTRRYSPFTMTKWMFYLSALTYGPCCLPELIRVPWTAVGPETWGSIAFIILFASCFSFLMLPLAQRYLRPTVVCVYNYLQPVVAAIIAVIIGVGEFGWLKLAATALIFIGVYFVNRDSAPAVGNSRRKPE